jgi:hypothetical protein
MNPRHVVACAGAALLVGVAGTAHAAAVDFRIVERTGQVTASGADPLLELAVQARVNGGSALGAFTFNIRTADAESRGTLQRAQISNGDHSYYSGSPWGPVSAVGIGGLASTYCYLAGISGSFNGLINTSSGTFTNNPNENEIGLVSGSSTGSSLLATPGMDADSDGNPDTFAGNGVSSPQNNDTAALSPGLAGTYFAKGQFIDVYRFRYTLADFTARTLHFTLAELGAQTFSQFVYSNGAWGPQNAQTFDLSTAGLDVQVIFPGPGTAGTLLLGGLVAARRRRARHSR